MSNVIKTKKYAKRLYFKGNCLFFRLDMSYEKYYITNRINCQGFTNENMRKGAIF